ncbi:hypothetical protein KAR48_02770 [bacterium]|nr:hypothetical protein [bacterium]
MLQYKIPENADTGTRIRAIITWLATILLAGLIFIISYIGFDVNRHSVLAMKKYKGDRVTAMTRLIDADGIPLNLKNDAIWALGQLGDARALPMLTKYFYDGECHHDSTICQYELKKAIAKCRGGFNITALFWRWTISPTDSLTLTETE